MSSINPGPVQRYRALDGYRFIAASLIVLFHYDGDFGLGRGQLTPVVRSLDVMVDFFFVLSGFVIAVTYGEAMSSLRDYGSFLRRRLARVLPLHLAVLCVFIGFALAHKSGVLTANHPEMLDLTALPANALLLHAWGTVGHLSFNAPSWSISAELLVYLAFPVLLIAARRLPLITNLALLVVGIVAISFFRSAMGLRDWTEATYDFGALRALPTFFLGVIFAILLKHLPLSIRVPWPVVHIVFLSSIAILQFGLPREVPIAMLALVVPLAAMAERGNRPSLMRTDFMARLGDASYSVYLIHILAEIPVLFILHKVHAIGTPLAVVGAVATYVAVVIAASLIYRRFEVPVRRWIAGGDQTPSLVFARRLQAAQLGPR
ncbi:MAG: acyltransferase [Rhizobiales bacterium]|nr:acyltransferase [Hyphomicrobiales bacterium]